MIITHQNLDLDAICGCWLLQKYGGFKAEEAYFVNTGNPDPDLLAQAVAVVDTGKIYDPRNWRFDHHQLPGQTANDTCAARQIYEWITQPGMDQGLDWLQPLIGLIFAGDTGRREADASRTLGLHALLWGYKSQYKEVHGVFAPDDIILAWGYQMLDILDTRLKKQFKARAELEQKTVYRSGDGLVWAIRHGSYESTLAAQEQGAVLTLFEGEPPTDAEGQVMSCPIGIQRGGENTSPHVGELVEYLLSKVVNDIPTRDELASWYCHPSGFFAGRGTGKAPDPRPIQVELADIARLVDQVWERQ